MDPEKLTTIDDKSTNPITSQHVLVDYLTKDVKQMKDKIEALEKRYIPPELFFKSAIRINNLSLVVFIILPILQLALTLILFFFFNRDDSFINVAKWIIGFLGFGALVELVYVPHRIKIIEDKIKKFEEE